MSEPLKAERRVSAFRPVISKDGVYCRLERLAATRGERGTGRLEGSSASLEGSSGQPQCPPVGTVSQEAEILPLPHLRWRLPGVSAPSSRASGASDGVFCSPTPGAVLRLPPPPFPAAPSISLPAARPPTVSSPSPSGLCCH